MTIELQNQINRMREHGALCEEAANILEGLQPEKLEVTTLGVSGSWVIETNLSGDPRLRCDYRLNGNPGAFVYDWPNGVHTREEARLAVAALRDAITREIAAYLVTECGVEEKIMTILQRRLHDPVS